MPIQYDANLKNIIDENMKEFAEPCALTGVELQKLTENYGLKLSETGNALGINTSALYGKQKAPKPLKTNVSILLRLYAAFDDHLPRITPPSVSDLVAIIQKADPDLPGYAVGPILGLEATSGHRLNETGFENAHQTTRVLAWLIHNLLTEDLGNWAVIKQVLMIEAEARGVPDPSTVFRRGGWSKYEPKLRHGNKPGQTGLVRKSLRRREE